MEDRNKRLAKNTAILYCRMGLSLAVSLFTSREVLRILGFADYGLYGVIGGVVSMFTFLNGSMAGASSRYIAIEIAKKDLRRLSKIFSTLFFSHIFIALIIFILSETVGLWFLWNKLVIPEGQKLVAFWVYQFSIVSTILGITNVPFSAVVIAHENMRIYAYITIAQVLLRLLSVYLLLIIPGSKLFIWALMDLIVQIGINIFYKIYVRRKYEGTELYIAKDKKLYKEIFGYAGSDLIGNISVLAQGQGLNILLNLFFGPTVNAARSLAYTVQGQTQMFSGNFLTAMRPQIIKLHGEDKDEEMLNLVENGSRLAFSLLWLIVLPVMLNIKYLLILWLGKFPEYTIPFLRIILLIALIQILKTPRTIVLHALAKLKWANIIVGSMLVMTFPIAYLFLKLGYGPTSVFWISFIIIMLTDIVGLPITKHYLPIFNIPKYLNNVYFRCLLIVIVSCILPIALKYKYPQPEFLPVLLNILLCVLCTGVSAYYIGLSKNQRSSVIRNVKNKIFRK